jgi:hypothetical protein
MSDDFFERYRDPRWQRKRLEIMKRDDFECVHCCAKDKTLNVHHGYYERDKMPWEYEDETLHTLCEDCHKAIGDLTLSIRRVMGRIPSLELLTEILGFISAMEASTYPWLRVHLADYQFADGVGAFWRVSADAVIDARGVPECRNCITSETLANLGMASSAAKKRQENDSRGMLEHAGL